MSRECFTCSADLSHDVLIEFGGREYCHPCGFKERARVFREADEFFAEVDVGHELKLTADESGRVELLKDKP